MALSITKDSFNREQAAEKAASAVVKLQEMQLGRKAGTLLLAAGEYEAARTRAELAIKAAPRHVPAHILLGNAMAGMSDTARAMKQIEEAIGLDPSYAPAWTSLGAMRFHGGQRAEAGEAFTRAIELAPKSADARLALANRHAPRESERQGARRHAED